MAEASSDMDKATEMIMMEAENQAQRKPAGPAERPSADKEAIEGKTPMILYAIPKTWKVEKVLFNSCL